MNFDMLAIPADAPHPHNALTFINYLLEPEVAARNSNLVKYANINTASTPMLVDAVKGDPNIYPPPDIQAKLVPKPPLSLELHAVVDAHLDALQNR